MVHVRNAVLTRGNGFRWSLSDKPSASDSEWYVEDVAGWYGGSGVRGDVTARLGHGDFVERGYREGRVRCHCMLLGVRWTSITRLVLLRR